jgi:hypothetical protein
MTIAQTVVIDARVTRLEFLSKSGMLIRLIIKNGDDDRFIASSCDFSMTAKVPDLRIYSNRFVDCEENIHWLTDSNDTAHISISESAFDWLREHELTASSCILSDETN